ncbi:hypothetical protein NX059_009447 [Plenodomus lindquistii]|nr:hypothetical protein NX059_009447 [Plenodomus lindquistii]
MAVGAQSTFILPATKNEALNTEDVDSNTTFCGRPVQSLANFGLIGSWLQLCTTNHQGRLDGDGFHAWYKEKEEHSTSDRGCSPAPSDPIPNFRLVDVKTRCVVCIDDTVNYAALSYVWGDSKRFFLCQENQEPLSLPGALDSHSHDLPRTFRDAIEIAEKLCIRYIWIDALCVVQDRPDQLMEHMDSMDVIYSAAVLTIVSDAASADAGIPGVSTSRVPPQATFQYNGTRYISAKKTFGQALEDSPWERRAWCLQEKVFSNRLLVFTETQAFFHCAGATWFEDTQMESKPNIAGPVHIRERPTYTRKKAMMYKAPVQTAYESHRDYFGRNFWKLIENYSQRSLSFEADIIRAFSGILRSIEQEHGVAIWGIPQREFGRGISFEHCGYRSGMRREGFPSWSWCGWLTSAQTLLEFVNFKRKDSDLLVSEGQYRVERGTSSSPETSFFDIDWHYYAYDAVTGETRPVAVQKTFQEPSHAEKASIDTTLLPLLKPLKPQRVSHWCIPGHPGEEDYVPPPHVPPLQHSEGMPPLTQVLQFYTSIAPVIVGPHTTTKWGNSSERTLHIPGSNETLEFSIDLDSTYDSHGKDTWLVYVSRWCTADLMSLDARRFKNRSGDNLNLLLVESVEGWGCVKRRVQLRQCVDMNSWRVANPQWKLVSLA